MVFRRTVSKVTKVEVKPCQMKEKGPRSNKLQTTKHTKTQNNKTQNNKKKKETTTFCRVQKDQYLPWGDYIFTGKKTQKKRWTYASDI